MQTSLKGYNFLKEPTTNTILDQNQESEFLDKLIANESAAFEQLVRVNGAKCLL